MKTDKQIYEKQVCENTNRSMKNRYVKTDKQICENRYVKTDKQIYVQTDKQIRSVTTDICENKRICENRRIDL